MYCPPLYVHCKFKSPLKRPESEPASTTCPLMMMMRKTLNRRKVLTSNRRKEEDEVIRNLFVVFNFF
jgi:hypothetical protein